MALVDFLQKSVKGKGEKGKGTQNPFPLTFSLSPLLQKYIFARGLVNKMSRSAFIFPVMLVF
ncbi:hypothetical protein BV372_15915 [Nostoc sp. T09]|nr:hypothetical protein BV372_15915 [Nostoc sp. T09]